MNTALHRVNSALHTDLGQVRIGLRTQGFLLALLLMIIASAATSAQGTQRDCYGDWMRAQEQIAGDMWRSEFAWSMQSYWWRISPSGMAWQASASYNYWVRSTSAYTQFLACSAIPIK